MDLELKDKRVLVTGGSRGIGLAIAHAYAAEGARVVLASRSEESLAAAAAAIAQLHGTTPKTIAIDLGTPGAAQALFERAGEVDVLVNNAGAIPGGNLFEIDEARWRAAWELKLFGYVNLTRVYLQAMQRAGHGVIVNIIGMAGVEPRFDYICGAAANAALIAFTRGVGGASVAHGVRVFGINPAATRSDRMQTLLRKQAADRLGDEERWFELTQKLPFGRMAEPEEIARLAVFCSSPACGYLSGTVIDVDGGQFFAPAGP